MSDAKELLVIDHLADLLSGLVDVGLEYGIYTNSYTRDELKTYIKDACFSGMTYRTSQKNRFPRLGYPRPCQKVSSSGKLAKSSIIHMAYNEERNTVEITFPITLLRKITILPNLEKEELDLWKDFIRLEIKASLQYIFKKQGIKDKEVFDSPALVKQYISLFEMADL